jgi:quercetin dioxygenase-like cupin family protein
MANAGDVIDNPRTGETITVLQTANDTGGALFQFEMIVQPSGFAVGPHTHPHQEERFKILSGQLKTWLDKRESTLASGDELVIPAGAPHYWTNAETEPVKMIVEFRPALRWETVFETVFGLARDGKTDKKGRPNPFQMAVIFDEFKDEAGPVTIVDRFLFKLKPGMAVLGRRMGYQATYPEYTRQN